jgi:dienelactone hydrolase
MKRLLGLIFLSVAVACVPYKPGPVAITLTAESSGRIYFQTTDVYDFQDALAGQATSRTIHGDLTFPSGTDPVRGAVILSHGSGGVGSLHRRYAERLVEQGLAVFLVDHFDPRDVGSTARDQLRVTAQGMLVDVVEAQKLLATHPRIPAEKIGHIGWSKGGIVALAGAVERLAGYAGQGVPFAFTAAFYPFCGFSFEEEKLSAPLLIQIGEDDNWTPAEPCKRLAAAWTENRQPVELRVYPGAHHGFDSRSTGFSASSAVTIRGDNPACRLVVTAQGQTQTSDGTQTLGSPEARTAFLSACGDRGIYYEGAEGPREAAWVALSEFIDTHLP